MPFVELQPFSIYHTPCTFIHGLFRKRGRVRTYKRPPERREAVYVRTNARRNVGKLCTFVHGLSR
jgi:hypothetical protein